MKSVLKRGNFISFINSFYIKSNALEINVLPIIVLKRNGCFIINPQPNLQPSRPKFTGMPPDKNQLASLSLDNGGPAEHTTVITKERHLGRKYK